MMRLVPGWVGDAALAAAGAGAVGFAVLACAMLGCASPGPPRPPSLHLPMIITSLRADRRGGDVVLRFVTPVRSTDGFALTGPVTASVCRAAGEAACVATGRRAVAGAVEWVDALPADLVLGQVRKLTYTVELFNAEGKSAGVSDTAVTAAGEAPRAVAELRAAGSRVGVRLTWAAESPVTGVVLLERNALAGGLAFAAGASAAKASGAKAGKKITVPVKSLPGRKGHAASVAATEPGQDKDTVWLRAESEPATADRGGTVDDTAVADVAYRYTAVRMRVVTVGGVTVEMRSARSAAVEFTLRDIYPPDVPLRLAAAAFPVEGSTAVAVDLIWQPDAEADVAGYNVYRAIAGSAGAAVKLNAEPVALPSFHDVTAARGVRYSYVVSAVDARGNASGMSEAAEVETPPKD